MLTGLAINVLSLLAQQNFPTQPQGPGGGDAVGGAIGLLFSCGCGLLGLLAVAFWIWMIVDAATRSFESDTEKIVWVLVVVLLQALGALIYFFVGRPRGTKQ